MASCNLCFQPITWTSCELSCLFVFVLGSLCFQILPTVKEAYLLDHGHGEIWANRKCFSWLDPKETVCASFVRVGLSANFNLHLSLEILLSVTAVFMSTGKFRV